jgi:hypothetical protein
MTVASLGIYAQTSVGSFLGEGLMYIKSEHLFIQCVLKRCSLLLDEIKFKRFRHEYATESVPNPCSESCVFLKRPLGNKLPYEPTKISSDDHGRTVGEIE